VDALIGFDLAENCPADLLSESGIPQSQRVSSTASQPPRKPGVRAAPAFELWIYDLHTNNTSPSKETVKPRWEAFTTLLYRQKQRWPHFADAPQFG